MFGINVILMLSTINPVLDCVSSFTIFNRKSIHIYPNAASIELSMHIQQNHHKYNNHHLIHQQQTPQPSPRPPAALLPTPLLPPTTSPPGHEINSWHEQINKNSDEQSDEEDYLKLNKSLRLDNIQEQVVEQLEEKLANDEHKHVSSTINIPTLNTTTKSTTTHLTTPTKTSTTTTPITTLITTEKPQNQLEDDAQYKLINEIVLLECVDFLKLEFCLNGGRCFLYPILNHSLSSCECAEGFVGERCEAKSYEYIPRIRPRLVLAKTRGGPLIYGLAIVDILFLLFLFCKNYIRD